MDKVKGKTTPSPKNPPAPQQPLESSIKPSCCSCCSKPFIHLLIVIFLVVAIAVGGYFLWPKIYPLTQPLGPSGAPTPPLRSMPTSIPDPTASWKKYRNEKIGIEFKYPQDYFKYIEDYTDQEYEENILLDLSIEPAETRNYLKEIGLFLVVQFYNGSLEESITHVPHFTLHSAPVTIAGVKGYKSIIETLAQDPVTRENFLNSDYKAIFKKNNFLYEFTLSGNKEKASIDIEKMFTQILSTFRFTD